MHVPFPGCVCKTKCVCTNSFCCKRISILLLWDSELNSIAIEQLNACFGAKGTLSIKNADLYYRYKERGVLSLRLCIRELETICVAYTPENEA